MPSFPVLNIIVHLHLSSYQLIFIQLVSSNLNTPQGHSFSNILLRSTIYCVYNIPLRISDANVGYNVESANFCLFGPRSLSSARRHTSALYSTIPCLIVWYILSSSVYYSLPYNICTALLSRFILLVYSLSLKVYFCL